MALSDLGMRSEKRLMLIPVITVVGALMLFWYALTLPVNHVLLEQKGFGHDAPLLHRWQASWALERPVLPAPHQVLIELKKSVIDTPLIRSTKDGWSFNKRNLLYHAGVTVIATLPGFALGTFLGILGALVLHLWPSMRAVSMPWLIASQAIPILALAPIVIVMLGSAGITGIIPKAVIAAYLSFFPVVIAMLKGLSSNDVLHRELMSTYSASRCQVLCKLSLPASMPYLLSSARIALSASFAGIIVAELPTGATSGLGARLLAGSYYGNTLVIWATLALTGVVVVLLLGVLTLVERLLGTHREPTIHT